MKTYFGLAALAAVLLLQGVGFSQDSTKNRDSEIQQLKRRISELEKKIENMQKAPAAEADTSDAALEAELARELGVATEAETQKQPQAPGISGATRQARRSFFQNMNPNVSVVGTVLGDANSLDAADRNVDVGFEEGEFAFQAAVDPYATADFFVAFGKESEPAVSPAGTGEEGGGGGGLNPEIEEAYITLINLPFSLQVKAGKFRSRFGKINETHPHAYNFIGVPLMYENFLGGEGLVDEGVSVSWLLPNSAFFQELTVQVTAGPLENPSFARADNNKLLYLAHLKNFFDLNDNTTLELGVTGLTGPHDAGGDNTQVLAGDLTLKWKPVRLNRYKSFEFLNEFLVSKRKRVTGDVTSIGFYSHARYQFAKRWFVGGLFDYAEYPEFGDFNRKAYSGILQFFATEFQKVELQYRLNSGNFFDNFSEFKLRAVFVIGAHGAHQY